MPEGEESQLPPSSAPAGDERMPTRPAVATLLPGGGIAEIVLDPSSGRTAFAVFEGGSIRHETRLTINGEHLLPYSGRNNLLRHNVILLPKEASEYESTRSLVA